MNFSCVEQQEATTLNQQLTDLLFETHNEEFPGLKEQVLCESFQKHHSENRDKDSNILQNHLKILRVVYNITRGDC